MGKITVSTVAPVEKIIRRLLIHSERKDKHELGQKVSHKNSIMDRGAKFETLFSTKTIDFTHK